MGMLAVGMPSWEGQGVSLGCLSGLLSYVCVCVCVCLGISLVLCLLDGSCVVVVQAGGRARFGLVSG
jgi:hypothetical protein